MIIANRPSMYPPGIINSNVSLYPNMIYGLDLRKFMDDILTSYGHYAMVRKYDTTRRSSFWNPVTKEAVGGPAWEYNDYIVKARKVIMTTGGTLTALETPTPMGLLSVDYVVYYFKWNSIRPNISRHDEIYEFDWSLAREPQVDEIIEACNVKYNIIESIDMLGDAGRKEFYKCLCKMDNVGH